MARHNPPVMDGTKVCIACSAEQPVTEFYPHKSMRDGRLNKCRTCSKAHTQKWRDNPENYAKWLSKRHKFNTMRSHGMTEAEYDGLYAGTPRCAGCGDDGSTRRLAVDHDHTTGAVRGLLCAPCNLVVGNVRDDAQRLRRLAAYVEGTPQVGV